MNAVSYLALACWLAVGTRPAELLAVPAPVPYRVEAKIADVFEALPPSAVQLTGFLGQRVRLNAEARLAQVDLEPLLAGFRQKPGSHPWIGEHIGKWMHAATLAWAYTGDVELERKLAYAAAELIKAQEPDGYLGTYVPEKRFGLFEGADWDVWSHKYCLIGLLTYYQFTGNAEALTASRKAADLLLATFGPDKKSLISAGTHVGMAATSVLEPMVLLYRFTDDRRYLDFARYIVSSWDEHGGPAILKSLREGKTVQMTANAKAYEMLSNLVGLCELYRVTGERDYLRAILNAWQDVVSHRLYLTGSASQSEHFRDDHELPNGPGAHVGETCVTTTWIQLNSQLLRLTGEARFGDELERTFYNHLTAAQHTAGADWCYFTALEGRKEYLRGINCCHSSGPRGVALIPANACFLAGANAGPPGPPAVALNLVELSEAAFVIGRVVNAPVGGRDFPSRFDVAQPVTHGTPVNVRIRAETSFPITGRSTYVLNPEQPVLFALKLRAPAWAGQMQARVNDDKRVRATVQDGWLTIPARRWQDGDRVELTYDVAARVIAGSHGNSGKAALAWGPFMLAYDQAMNPGLPDPLRVGLPALPDQPVLQWSGPAIWPLRLEAAIVAPGRTAPELSVWIPFADAGAQGSRFAVWVRGPGAPASTNESLFAFADESRSESGNVHGSITDGDPGTYVVTFNGKAQQDAWFAVTAPAPVEVRRVVVTHGWSFHDGGWFDTATGKPRVEARRSADASWERLGELVDYPATTATGDSGLKPGQQFTLRLASPMRVVALRIVGKPASGDDPGQAFASCAELEAYGD